MCPSILHSGTESSLSMTGGSPSQARRFASFGAFLNHYMGITPPTPITVPWSRSRSILAQEFIDDAKDEVVFIASPASVVHHSGTPSCVFSSFGEFASTVLGLSPPSSTVHVFWEEKP